MTSGQLWSKWAVSEVVGWCVQSTHGCGDLIFSSHTIFMLTGMLTYNEYGTQAPIKVSSAAFCLVYFCIVYPRCYIASQRDTYRMHSMCLARWVYSYYYQCSAMPADIAEQLQRSAWHYFLPIHHPCCIVAADSVDVCFVAVLQGLPKLLPGCM